MKKVYLHNKNFNLFIESNNIQEAIKKVAVKINSDYEDKRPLFIAVLNGSFLFFADLIKQFNGDCDITFIKVASYEGTTSSGIVKELIGLNEDISGRDVIIIEDIVDTGNTIETIYDIILKSNPKSLNTATLLFKPNAYTKKIEILYKAIEVGNEFLVGYGLDYNGLGRNLKDIYIVE